MNAEAERRLDQAESLLSTDIAALDGVWPRCAAWLIRLALERAVDGLWQERNPPLIHVTKRAQLLALGRYVDADVQARAAWLWSALSRAGHHHHYELAPTLAELQSWLTEARAIAEALPTKR
jgi:hypothetical protein